MSHPRSRPLRSSTATGCGASPRPLARPAPPPGHAPRRHFFGRSSDVPSDPARQAAHLRDLNRASQPEKVVQLYESGAVAASEANLSEYLKALVRVDRLNESALLRTLQRGAAAEAGGSAGSAASGGSVSNRAAAIMTGAAESTSFSAGGAVNSASSSSSAASAHVLGTASSPIYTQQLEPTFRAQMWRTIRTLGVAFVVLSGIGALADDRGGVTRSIMGGGEKPKPSAETKTKFADVKGVDEAKGELVEIVEYLRSPEKFTRLGGKLPKGLLLVGPPGTGKTMLARAVAGEAGVPFFYTSGSEFEEMFVGVGARRVRDLFKAAKQAAPCIVFIDEIDAVGSARNPKDQQNTRMTLNQLLTELDGFRKNEGVIVLAATNTPETLDKALVRPGRFDRTVAVPNPDVDGRKQILATHANGVKIARGVDWEVIARGTPGFSGADLANLVNVAALKAALDGAKEVGMSQLEHAKDRIMMGAERKSAVVAEENRRLTAYHEGGHALVALFTDGARPIHKATIVPRGQSLGMVMQLPEKDELNLTKKQLLAMLDVTMGGRVAEELIFGAENVTTGASSDLRQATRLAREMVTKYGFSDKCGLASTEYGDYGLSHETRGVIEDEVKEMLHQANKRATKLLKSHEKELHMLAETLLDRETLNGAELRRLCGLKAKAGDAAFHAEAEKNAAERAGREKRTRTKSEADFGSGGGGGGGAERGGGGGGGGGGGQGGGGARESRGVTHSRNRAETMINFSDCKNSLRLSTTYRMVYSTAFASSAP
jgi:ATP-dependent metalloprotease